jgi:nucleotide-binding universal stress UspA family protein
MDKKQVVVAYDFSETADVALERAVDIACRAPDHVLHFVSVLESHQAYTTAEKVQDELLERLRRTFDERAPGVDIEFFVHARIGRVVHEILELAEEVGADMIVVGSHGLTGVRRLLLGSVSEAVVRAARCPVVIARPKGYAEVVRDRVVPVEAQVRRPRPHRYSYSSSVIQSRPSEWPLL